MSRNLFRKGTEHGGASRLVAALATASLALSALTVAPGIAQAAIDSPQNTVTGVSPRGTTINLFDYWVTGKDAVDDGNWQANQANQGINNGHTLKFGKGMGESESPFTANTGNVNQWTKSAHPRTGIVANNLDEDGYPTLSESLGGQSLDYLFDNSSFDGKAAYSDVDGLLQVDEDGYYYYNSQENFAQFNDDGDGSGDFTLYDTWGVKRGGQSPNGQFFPFNTGEQVFDEERDGGITQKDISSTNSIIKHYFGMHMSTRFIQQYGGHNAPEGTMGRQEVTYNFSGDDDVWIYIDGVLVGDLGGIHNATSIEINFATGRVLVYNDSTFSDGRANNNQYDQGETIYNGNGRGQTLAEIMRAAGVTANLDGDTFADGTYHTLDFFYLERGNTDSNMSLKYNLVNIPESGIVKVDQYGTGLSGIQFTLQQANANYEAVTGTTPVTGRTNANGEMIFTYENNAGQEIPITLEQLGSRSGYWILTETIDTATNGYRSTGTVKLRFSKINNDGTGDGVLLSSNQWETGAYSQAHVTATATTTVADVDGGTHDPANGLMFAVVTKINNGDHYAVTGDAFSGWDVATTAIDDTASNKGAIVDAAKASGYIFLLGSGGAYQTTIEDLPGDITTYEYMIENGQGSTETAQYAVKYYWSNATSLDNLSASSTIVEIDPNAGQGFDRMFSVTLSIPNIKNELALHKTNADGTEDLQGAVYALYADANGNGKLDAGEQPVAESLTTDQNGMVEVYSDVDEKLLANGNYVLVETKAPTDYVLDDAPIQIVVDDDGVHVNAGKADDNVSVETGIGDLVYSMRSFAADDQIDATLHEVQAQPETATAYEGEQTDWKGVDGVKLHFQYRDETDDNKFTYQPSNGGDATYTANAGWSRFNVTQCMSDEHESGNGTDYKQNLGNRSLNGLFTGDVTIHVTNDVDHVVLEGDTNLEVTKSVVGAEWNDAWEFTFTIAPHGNVTERAVADGDITMPDPATATVTAEQQTAAFGDIVFRAEGTYEFVVTENDLAEGIDGVSKDESEKIVTVKVERVDGKLQASVVADSSDELAFTNTADLTLDVASTLAVVKNLHASADTADMVQADADTYNFTVTAQDTKDGDQVTTTAAEAAAKLGLADGTELSFANEELVQGADTYVWSDTMNPIKGMTFTAADRGKTFTYVIDEVEPDQIPTGYVFDTDTRILTITVSDNTADALSVSAAVDGKPVAAGEVPTVTFDNRIEAATVGGDDADAAIAVEKTVNVATDKDFAFTLALTSAKADDDSDITDGAWETDENGDLAAFDGMDVSVTDAFTAEQLTNSASFGKITFTEPGTYTFTVTETEPGDGWTCETEPQKVVVTVSDDFTATVEGSPVAFANTYEASGDLPLDGSADIKLTKALTGRDWIEGDAFTFTLTGEAVDGSPADGFTLPAETTVTVDYADAVAEAGEGNATEDVEVPFGFDKITFTKPGIYEFTVTEGEITAANVTNANASVTYRFEVTDENQNGQLTIKPVQVSQAGTGDFVNEYNPSTAPAGMRATKTVNDASEGIAAGAFTFQVEAVSAPDGVTAKLPAGVDANGQVKNGANGTVNFGDLSFDTEGSYVYKVTEVNEGKTGYTYDDTVYYVVYDVADDPETGALYANATFHVGSVDGEAVEGIAFSNTYQPEEVTTPDPTGMGFSGVKTVDDEHGEYGVLEAGDFTFVIKNTQAPAGVTAPMPEHANENGEVSNDADGTFSFGTITFTEPGEYTYVVSEKASGIAGVTDSTEQYTLHFKVDDIDGKLVIDDTVSGITNAAGEQVDGAALNFVNTYNDGEVSYQIAGTKVLDTAGYQGASLAEGDFTFVLVDADGNEVDRVTNGAANGNTASFAFGPITYTEPGEHVYTVYEVGVDGGLGTGGIDADRIEYSTKVYTVTVTVASDEDAVSGDALTVSADVQNADIVFTNTYDPEPAVVGPEGSAQIAGTKVYQDMDGNALALEGGEFTFELRDGDQVIEQVANDETGAFIFSALTFDEVGSYTYSVAEVNDGAHAGVTYDTNIYGVRIDVTEDADAHALVAKVTYTDPADESKEIDELAFTNTYKAEATSASFGVSKELKGGTLAEGQFSFELTGSEGAPMPEKTTVVNAADGSVNFGVISYDKAGEYDYTITEVNDGQDGIVYDENVDRTVHVSVTDNGEGTLVAEVTFGEDGSHFVNEDTTSEDPKDPEDPEDPQKPGEGEEPGDGEKPGKGDGSDENLAQTGDYTVAIVGGIVVVAAILVIVGVVMRRRS